MGTMVDMILLTEAQDTDIRRLDTINTVGITGRAVITARARVDHLIIEVPTTADRTEGTIIDRPIMAIRSLVLRAIMGKARIDAKC